jgi:uncharacterized repeat protein (TIGR01451 family)
MTRAAARRVAVVTALVVGAGVVVSAGLGGTASGGLRAKKAAPLAPSRADVVRLRIGLRVVPRTATRGRIVTYLMRVSNTGDETASALRVCDQVPRGLTFLSGPPNFRNLGGSVCRTFRSLPPGVTLILNFKMQVSSSAPTGVVVNTATARAAGTARLSASASLTIVERCPTSLNVKRPFC